MPGSRGSAPSGPRTARDDYGRSKVACEEAILAASPQATVLRIGWQIDFEPTGNDMVAALDAGQAREGSIGASRLWTPASSFLADTAAAPGEAAAANSVTVTELAPEKR